MSTNFYFAPAEDAKDLALFGELHIGIASGGWEFGFQAYAEAGGPRRVAVNNDRTLTMGIVVPPLIIKSWDDWKRILTSTDGIIQDEYGHVMSFVDFEEYVKLRSPGKYWGDGCPLRNHYDYLVENVAIHGPVDPEVEWKDNRGFSFSTRDFS